MHLCARVRLRQKLRRRASHAPARVSQNDSIRLDTTAGYARRRCYKCSTSTYSDWLRREGLPGESAGADAERLRDEPARAAADRAGRGGAHRRAAEVPRGPSRPNTSRPPIPPMAHREGPLRLLGSPRLTHRAAILRSVPLRLDSLQPSPTNAVRGRCRSSAVSSGVNQSTTFVTPF
jgi:hypothetical protein